jgi:pyruvate dehydrogenase E2 component (dihydrolipoamide acetyltransferase)
MDSLVLLEWRKTAGESVEKGEVLYVVETDKASLEVEAPASGILVSLLVEPGSEVKIGSKIGVIAAPAEAAAPETGATKKIATVPAAPAAETAQRSRKDQSPERQDRIFASPRARRLALQEGIALAGLTPSGPQGMIVERDVQAFLARTVAQPKATPLAKRVAETLGVDIRGVTATGPVIRRADVEAAARPQTVETTDTPARDETGSLPPVRPGSRKAPLSSLRKTIARRLQEGQQASVPVTLTREVDVTDLVALRQAILADIPEGEVRPSYTDFLVHVLARCLKIHEPFNSHFDGETLEIFDSVNLGLAVDTERGLIVPVLPAVEKLGILALARMRVEKVQRTLSGEIRPEELAGGTFTLTNLGSLGVDSFNPVINPPQIAILGVGRIRSAAAPYQGQIAIREMLVLSLTFDHRAVDGAPAARLLQDIALRLEKPHMVWL